MGFLLGFGFKASAQPMYTMQNATVTDCEGVLTDSENGPETGQYDHNEDYTFTVCVDGANEIIIAFNFFSTEETYDVLTIHDGPNTASPVLAMLTGSLQPPPVFIATSGCVTFHFTSDDNIVAAGWEVEWSVEIDDPVPPTISVVSMLDCPMDAITFQFSILVDCGMMSPGQFSLIGPGGPSIAQVNPLDCMPGETGQMFEVVFTSPLSQSGTYRLLFNGAIQDACGEWHDVSANVVFDLTNCPFTVEINLVDDACAGDCGTVEAEIIGGDAGVSYQFMWSHTPLNQAKVSVCTDVNVPLTVTVTNPLNATSASATYTYVPLENPVILNPIQDTVCSSRADHFYQSSLPGGLYYSNIIPDWLRAEGRYQFWRHNWTGPVNVDIVTYVAPNGCEAYDTVIVLPVDPGGIQAACLGAPDFQANGGNPAGGIWQGPHISPSGTFSPVAAGSFVVNYTAPNGCIGYKRINVSDTIIMPLVDTICSSQEFDLVANPYGGVWSGPGIVNAVAGRIRPWTVATNQTYTYVYTLQGCTDTMQVFIQELWAGQDVEVCDADSLLYLTQDGSWSGPGVYIPALNAFDISGLGPGEYDYTITAFGCSDAFRLYISEVYADLFEPVILCQEDEWHPLTDFIEFYPDWGDFSGPAIGENNDEWFFNPALAGGGAHWISFDAFGCRDSFQINVEDFADITDYSFCELSPAQQLTASPAGGTWMGPGFLDTQIGLFDPQLLSPGAYEIFYTTPLGCTSSDTVDIILLEQVSIDGVNQFYCFKDTLINVNIMPLGGDFFINGALASPSFNPALLGTGTHELYYERGTGACASDERIFFSVLPPIDGNISPPDSICAGENAVIGASATGGTGTLRANWDQGIGFGFSHIVRPVTSTTYNVTIADGCSDPFQGSAYIHVYQPFDIETVTGPPVCYEDTSFIEIIPPDPDLYAVYWQLDSIYEGTYLEGKPGIYLAEVVELFSGCSQEFDLQIPGPPPLSANFSTIPNNSCVDIIDNTVQLIDLSTGATEGWIDFGDGTPAVPYIQGELIQHDYDQIGDFIIHLLVTNELGCTDTISRIICVENKVVIYIPNVFSPNSDGQNDVFKMEAFGINDVMWTIYTRWGEVVFESGTMDDSWDGTFKGKNLDPGVYVIRLTYTDQATGERGERIMDLTLVR
jgi:gliding motility-associated-like protein